MEQKRTHKKGTRASVIIYILYFIFNVYKSLKFQGRLQYLGVHPDHRVPSEKRLRPLPVSGQQRARQRHLQHQSDWQGDAGATRQPGGDHDGGSEESYIEGEAFLLSLSLFLSLSPV